MMAVKKQSSQKMLSTVLAGEITLPVEFDVVVKNLVSDSREIQIGDVFIALKGESVNAIDYIDTAIDAGAAAIIWDSELDAVPFSWSKSPNKIPMIAITNLKDKLVSFAINLYGNNSENINIVGVTGTNGKTSCVNFIAQALQAEAECGLIGTLGLGVYPNLSLGNHTTPDVLTVHKAIASFVQSKAQYAAVEVSSHALAQGRVDGVKIKTAIFTNLTQDHLDYHKTMERYFNEKLKLFQRSDLENVIINIDSAYAEAILKEVSLKNIITYGLDITLHPDVYATNIQYGAEKTEFILHTSDGSIPVTSNLVGDFNVSNILAVCSYLILQGFQLEKIAEAISHIQSVDGRMQKIQSKGFPLVVVDYAHTADALEHVLNTLSKQFPKTLCCVFGCGGERDHEKREQMGAVASSYANEIILTNDNPRSEKPESIVEQILKGIADKDKVSIELDRKKAIQQAIRNTKETGCILIAGKGHESYQIIGKKKIDFNDAHVVKEVMGK